MDSVLGGWRLRLIGGKDQNGWLPRTRALAATAWAGRGHSETVRLSRLLVAGGDEPWNLEATSCLPLLPAVYPAASTASRWRVDPCSGRAAHIGTRAGGLQRIGGPGPRQQRGGLADTGSTLQRMDPFIDPLFASSVDRGFIGSPAKKVSHQRLLGLLGTRSETVKHQQHLQGLASSCPLAAAAVDTPILPFDPPDDLASCNPPLAPPRAPDFLSFPLAHPEWALEELQSTTKSVTQSNVRKGWMDGSQQRFLTQ
ncbi:hypothetical protein CKAH01_16607 [Colletotrichum kahawae]|uniref:Uncharacterized protein n=1 Tax=Colletotrichum kahawae TaxID=34407 RepID=A0AAD9YFH6_COLKA|nr:hypothetical protein CKAH01_16607 [Colletotrichum kahawae]